MPVAGDDELAQLARSNLMRTASASAREQRREFLESVSHELKTPLTSIRGSRRRRSVMARCRPRRRARDRREADGSNGWFPTCSTSRGSSGRGSRWSARRWRLSDVADRAVERHALRARELHVELNASHDGQRRVGDPGAPAPGDLEPDRERAADHPGGRLGHGLRSRRRDRGAGHRPRRPPEDLPRAFERFYLYERYRSERDVGSGLGLAIVGELAGRMGGDIAVENVDGGGARFTLRVPQP